MELSLLVRKGRLRQLVLCPYSGPEGGLSYAVGFTSITSNDERVCKIDLVPPSSVEPELHDRLLPHVWGCLGLLSVGDGKRAR